MSYINTETNQYPITEKQIKIVFFPNTSFSDPFRPPKNFEPVMLSPQPEYDSVIQRVVEITPISVNNKYMQQWQVVSKFVEYTDDDGITHTVEEQEANAIDEANQQKNKRIFDRIVSQVQKRLDEFAQTRNYDGILSLATYATDPNPKFSAEGQYGVEARSATWAKLYEILAEVGAGTRPVPSGYTEIEPELPELEWPE
jgi:hypothetical protein